MEDFRTLGRAVADSCMATSRTQDKGGADFYTHKASYRKQDILDAYHIHRDIFRKQDRQD